MSFALADPAGAAGTGARVIAGRGAAGVAADVRSLWERSATQSRPWRRASG